MIEVEYQARTKVIIHEYSKYDSLETLVKSAYGGLPPGAQIGPLKWVEGVVLSHSAFPMTDEIVRELLKGILHWNHVSFAPLDEYIPNYHDPDLRLSLSISDVSGNPTFKAIGSYIKEKLLNT